MANPSRKGFRPVRSINGLTSWDLSLAEPYAVDLTLLEGTEASSIVVGHPVLATTAENTVAGPLGHLRQVIPMTDEHLSDETTATDEQAANGDLIAGVVVGISRIGDMTGFNTDAAWGLFHGGPDDLSFTRNYITSAEVEADPDGFLIWCANASDWIFEGAVEAADQEIAPGYRMIITTVDDGSDEMVDTTTGSALVDLVQVAAMPQAMVTHVPRYVDNDAEAADARVWFKFNPWMTDLNRLGSTANDAVAS